MLKWIKLHYGDLQLIALSKKCQSFIQDILAPLDPTKYDLDDISNVSNDLGRNSELNRLDKPKYEFRDYQYEAVKALLASGRGHGLIEIPTAGGKSFILANFIWNILKNVNREAKTLILVPNV
nr:MAG TPA: Chromatin remodeling complex ATPase [Caudoviricetes sp.]